ncbi:thrombospondin type 1 domain-containing protein [Ditylenchus destructor]|uniref:Thrombospondin type 1 domain-containing protein n=1 Tax=Ditylenchus destructor TaxID=166010 RepID=A0AAD4N6D0_9BILA|nr:thrombospondin type 1 domain-containing protein [Ditylenchus destructor]
MKLSNNIIANFHLFTCKNVGSLIFLFILAVDILSQEVVSRELDIGCAKKLILYNLLWKTSPPVITRWAGRSGLSGVLVRRVQCGEDGIQFQLRRCLDMYCSGPPSRHRLCPDKPCPNDRVHQSDAQIECALRNRPPFGFLPDKWTPVTAINNCSLSCRSEQTGKIKHFGISLKDGAKCKRSDSRHSACQAGKCQPIGCDRIIGSVARTDECGRCGGDGSSCAKKIFRWKDTLQFTPCDKTCGPNSVRVSVSVCVNTATERVVPERLCADQERPRPQVKRCPYVVCPAKWLTGSWTDCSATCGSGQQYRQVFCVETHSVETPAYSNSSVSGGKLADAVENRKVADQYCWQQQKPITERECGAPCPAWEIGDWGECSETCGKGLRKRNVECRQGNERTEDIMCSDQKRPVQSQPCYTGVKCPAPKGSNSAVSNASPPHYRLDGLSWHAATQLPLLEPLFFLSYRQCMSRGGVVLEGGAKCLGARSVHVGGTILFQFQSRRRPLLFPVKSGPYLHQTSAKIGALWPLSINFSQPKALPDNVRWRFLLSVLSLN